jgi:hypothetical protein
MILPTKHLSEEQALLTLGGEILSLLDRPQTMSTLWDNIRLGRAQNLKGQRLSYGWFVLSLDLLFIIGAVKFESGTIRRADNAS